CVSRPRTRWTRSMLQRGNEPGFTISPERTIRSVEEATMDIDPLIHALFGRFQNLNLLILREDLRRGLVARGNWLDGGDLCPVAHGLADGVAVAQLCWQSQAIGLKQACHGAARYLGALPADVYRFVELW